MTILSVDDLYETLDPRSCQPGEFTKRMERLRAFKSDYENFARVANKHFGEEFFRAYVPGAESMGSIIATLMATPAVIRRTHWNPPEPGANS